MEALTIESLPAYLVARGALPAGAEAEIVPLGGGISNDVWRVRWPDGGDGIVVKQALPFLRVAEVWAYDVSRSAVEHRALREIGRLLGPGHAPAVVFTDDERHVFGMTCAPTGGAPWKERLLAGTIDVRDAYRAGDLLGRIHAASAAARAAAPAVAAQATLVEGRIDPYHRATADRHPDLAPMIDAEVERLLATRRALVLGDYAPKNLLAYPDRMLVLDVEVAHWGDPAFDVAFCLNHLCLKALHLPRQRALLVALARALHGAYAEQAPGLADEAAVVAELGILMVARVDGKSPAEYLDQVGRERARALGRSLVLDPPSTVMRALERVEVGA
ncbi:MAG: phosphotransferase [Gaiellales bacterium]